MHLALPSCTTAPSLPFPPPHEYARLTPISLTEDYPIKIVEVLD